MKKDATNAERQRRFRQRRKKSNGGVTATIHGEMLVTDEAWGIVARDGHTYYTTAAGKIFAVVCCGVKGCGRCGS